MSHKPNASTAPLHTLSGFSLLAAEGPGAEAFLQAQTMNDVRALAPLQWQWNGWLNAKGRVIALFALLRTSPDAFWLLLPDFPAGDLQPLLQRYVLRSKLSLRVVEDWLAAASFHDECSTAATRDRALGDGESGYVLDFGGDAGGRWLHLRPGAAPNYPGLVAEGGARWRDLDLRHGLARLDAGQREAWTPQMLSLDRLKAFSLRKGCYPGQEIVARTHYLGQAKRELAGLEGAGLVPGDEIRDTDGPVGQVVSASGDGGLALAVVTAGRSLSPSLSAPGGPCRPLALAGGLARPA